HDNMHPILGFCHTRSLCREVHSKRAKSATLQQSQKRGASTADIQQVETIAIPRGTLNEGNMIAQRQPAIDGLQFLQYAAGLGFRGVPPILSGIKPGYFLVAWHRIQEKTATRRAEMQRKSLLRAFKK